MFFIGLEWLENLVLSPFNSGLKSKKQIARSSHVYFNGGIPGCCIESVIKPTHVTDSIIVTHQRVLPPAVRDGVEIAAREERGGQEAHFQNCNNCAHTLLTHCCPMRNRWQFCHQPTSSMRIKPEKKGGGGCCLQRWPVFHKGNQIMEETELGTMLEKETLLWNSFSSLENIFRVESEIKMHIKFIQHFKFKFKLR